MGCNEFLTKEDDALIEASMRGENTGFSEETLERDMPEVHKAMAESAQRELAFEQNAEDREIIKELSEISPEENEKIEQERQGEEITTFRTLSGEFAIRQTPGSHLTTEEVRRIYREETSHCVVSGMQRTAHINRLRESIDEQGKTKITLGDHRRSFYKIDTLCQFFWEKVLSGRLNSERSLLF